MGDGSTKDEVKVTVYGGHFRCLCSNVTDKVIFEIDLKGMREWLLGLFEGSMSDGVNSKSKGFGISSQQGRPCS